MSTRAYGVVAVLLLLTAFAVPAQDQDSPEDESSTRPSMVENDVLGIQAGFAGGYRLDDSEMVAGQSFALNLSVATNVQAQFATMRLSGNGVTDNHAVLRIAYYFSPLLGFNIAVGSAVLDVDNAATATQSMGAGVFFNAFRSSEEDMLSSALKVSLDYLATTEQGFDGGTIALGLSAVFGL